MAASDDRDEVAFRRLTTRALLAPAVLIVLLTVLLVGRVAATVASFRSFEGTSMHRARLSAAYRQLVDFETGLRGYLITGAPVFLEPYERARTRIEPRLSTIATNVPPEEAPEVLPRIERIRERYGELQRHAERMMVLRRGGGDYASPALNAEGKALMDAIRAELEPMLEATDRRLDERSRDAQRAAIATLWTGAAVGVALLLAVAFGVRRRLTDIALTYARARSAERERTAELLRKQEEVNALNRTLEERVIERTQQLEAANQQLEGANQQLEAFSYSVSHDLRGPLRAMQGLAQVLLEDFAQVLGEDGSTYASKIVGSAERMDVLIQDLLAYSRLSRADLGLAPVPLGQATDRALAQLEDEIRARGATITVADPLPEVVAHAVTLTQVVTNLVGNAIKFMPPDRKPVVRVHAEERGDRARLWVEDNGIGIAPEHQSRIFGVFERLHGVEEYAGTGIGLAIVKKAVERMGGAAGVESTPGQGSRFWIELPRPTEPA